MGVSSPTAEFPPAQHLGTALLSRIPTADHGYFCDWDSDARKNLVLVVTFDGTTYPFEHHCRYASQRDPSGKYTFENMDFKSSPPGIRVGPWPGWRGIPDLPSATVEICDRIIPVQFQFWGDELSQRKIRGVAYLESGETGRFSIRVSDTRLVPVQADFYAVSRPAIALLSVEPPEELLLRHPRLLVYAEDLPRLRNTENPERRLSLERVLRQLDRWDLPFSKTTESKIPAGVEGLSEEDRLLIGAFVALLYPAEENVLRAVRAYFEYIHKTQEKNFEPLAIDTQAGEVLFLLCVGYDWLYDLLSIEERDEARRRLWEVAELCWNHLGYGRRDYAQAHYLGCGMGLLAFSLLFLEEHPRAKEWSAYLHGVVRWVCSSLSPDGFFPHGLNLWIYEFGFLLRWLELLRTAGGIDLWSGSASLSSASRFRAAATSPDGLCGITMGDPQYRVGGDSWCHYLIAARTGSGLSQWLGDLLRELPAEGLDYRNAPVRRRVYEHLWFDEGISPREPEENVVLFPDGGQLFVRSGKSVLTFRSGSPLGEHRYRSGIQGAYGHGDPCNGSFLYYEGGDFLISGPGPVYRRDSALHNVMTFDGQGQVGDTAVWLPDFVPPEIRPPAAEIRLHGGTVAVAADLAPCYLPHLGIEEMHRSLLLWPGRFLVGTDLVRLRERRSIEWNLHSWGEFTLESENGILQWIVSAGQAGSVRVFVFEPLPLNWVTGQSEFVPAYPNNGMRDSFLRLSTDGRSARFVWALLFSGEGPPAAGSHANASLQFRDGTCTTFDGKWITILKGRETNP